ncbi:hypothetical protein LOAG_13929 [Loa loa]|uniref:Uncharacterized protein n=1 Tax=Loa loa TaxID=7209 RepID=A0A1S0TK06_LOALO|nr:hypothetical protein LOAG_13929 [Loa loa]EFO14589.1 hypothetical protein LOAG_13929 [Loa loa]
MQEKVCILLSPFNALDDNDDNHDNHNNGDNGNDDDTMMHLKINSVQQNFSPTITDTHTHTHTHTHIHIHT